MIRTGYATIRQTDTPGDPDIALQAIAWQASRTTAGDLVYQWLRCVENAGLVIVDTDKGYVYATNDQTTMVALLAAVPVGVASVTFKPKAGQTGVALKWDIDGEDHYGCDVTEITSGQRRSVASLVNYVLGNTNQTYKPIAVIDQTAGKVRFTHPQGSEASDLVGVTKQGESYAFALKERSGSQLVFEGGQLTSLSPAVQPADWAANGGLRVWNGNIELRCPDDNLWYAVKVRLEDGKAVLDIATEGIE